MLAEKSDVQDYAAAELFLCENAGPLIRELIERAQDTFGVTIRELRIVVEHQAAAGLSGVNCNITA
jgi:hypothetical protein